MEPPTPYERFPWPLVLLANGVTLLIYGIGTYLLSGLGLWWALAYLAYCGWVESRVLTKSCVNCYYYGKVCCFGKGRLCALIFKRGDPQKFAETTVSWFDLAPDFMVLVLPVVGGVVQLVGDFSGLTLALLVVLVALSFGGNAVVRGSFACRHCKQRAIGCPAEKLFSKSGRNPPAA